GILRSILSHVRPNQVGWGRTSRPHTLLFDTRCKIYIAMKRPQLYLDDDIARILSTVSRQKRQTVSELVRECVTDKFGKKEEIDRAQVARELGGLWKNRKDFGETRKYARKLRTDTRVQRL